ncbi:MAG: hypothetical protein ABI164_09820 [Acidobacteriaceae bacterium]
MAQFDRLESSDDMLSCWAAHQNLAFICVLKQSRDVIRRIDLEAFDHGKCPET